MQELGELDGVAIGELEGVRPGVVGADAERQDVDLAGFVGPVVADLDDLGTALDLARSRPPRHQVELVQAFPQVDPADQSGRVRGRRYGDACG